jgi:hypothetical protein
MNLFYGQTAIGTMAAFQQGGALRPGGHFLRRKVMRTLRRSLQDRPVVGRHGIRQ